MMRREKRRNKIFIQKLRTKQKEFFSKAEEAQNSKGKFTLSTISNKFV